MQRFIMLNNEIGKIGCSWEKTNVFIENFKKNDQFQPLVLDYQILNYVSFLFLELFL